MELILIIDKEIDSSIIENCLYIKEEEKLISTNLKIFSKFCKLHNNYDNLQIRDLLNEEKVIRELDNNIGEERRELLKNQKNNILNITVFLNSPGGRVMYSSDILDILKYIRNSNGEVTSYSFYNIASAAADIFSFSTKRYCLNFSEFMFHITQTNGEFDSNEDESKEEYEKNKIDIALSEYEEELKRVFQNDITETRHLINEALENFECDLYLSGSFLAQLQSVNCAFGELEEFIDFIQEDIGYDIEDFARLSEFIWDIDTEKEPNLENTTYYFDC